MLVAAAYLTTLGTPLRLTPDATAYLDLGARLADGAGLGPSSTGVTFPPGWPAAIAGLDRAGLGSTAWLVALVLVCLAVALGAVAWLCVHGFGLSRLGAACVCLATLLSFVVVKHAAIPQSELPFFALASVALVLLVAVERRPRALPLVAALVTVAAACAVRTAGVALLPAVVVALPGRRARLAAGGALGIGLLVAVWLGPDRYLDELRDRWSAGFARQLLESVRDTLRGVGELVTNVPSTQVPGAVDALLVTAGVVGLLLVGVGVEHRRGRPYAVVAYVVATLLLVLAWGVTDVRFLVSLVPFVALYGWEGLRSLVPRPVALAVVVLVGALGIVALGFSARITFSGDRFPERYGDGELTPTYRVAFDLARPGDAAQVQQDVLAVLRRFEPRARP